MDLEKEFKAMGISYEYKDYLTKLDNLTKVAFYDSFYFFNDNMQFRATLAEGTYCFIFCTLEQKRIWEIGTKLAMSGFYPDYLGQLGFILIEQGLDYTEAMKTFQAFAKQKNMNIQAKTLETIPEKTDGPIPNSNYLEITKI